HRQSLSLCRFLRFLSTEAPSLHRHYPVSTVLRASPSPHTARPGSRELPVDPNLPSPLGLPVLRLVPCVCMPSPLPRQVRWNRFAHHCSIDVGLPQITVGSAPALSVSWPAQRSLALQPADLPGRLMRPSTPEAPAASLPSPPLRLLPGGAIQFPGGPFIPLWTSAFHGALLTPGYISYRFPMPWTGQDVAGQREQFVVRA